MRTLKLIAITIIVIMFGNSCKREGMNYYEEGYFTYLENSYTEKISKEKIVAKFDKFYNPNADFNFSEFEWGIYGKFPNEFKTTFDTIKVKIEFIAKAPPKRWAPTYYPSVAKIVSIEKIE